MPDFCNKRYCYAFAFAFCAAMFSHASSVDAQPSKLKGNLVQQTTVNQAAKFVETRQGDLRGLFYPEIRKAKRENAVGPLACMTPLLLKFKGVVGLLQNAELTAQEVYTHGDSTSLPKVSEKLVQFDQQAQAIKEEFMRCWGKEEGDVTPSTVVTIKQSDRQLADAYEIDVEEGIGDEVAEDLDENFGFPAIPPASPFR